MPCRSLGFTPGETQVPRPKHAIQGRGPARLKFLKNGGVGEE